MNSYSSSPRPSEFSLPPIGALIRACMVYDDACDSVRRQSASDILLSHPIKGFPNPARPETWHHRYTRSLSLASPGPLEEFPRGRFACDHCDASFSRKNSLKRHLFTHNHERPYSCTSCSRAFYRADIYHRHLKSKKCQLARS
ncbi:hypothetical protein DSO57_1036696 [Entomophthora muscae]|uniref:Uncharacterized protein n=2 Tax=Entomophthora muscae TaxID=34485 RepID=A0ACC2UJR9_9FUNG|nr:hypothetical protein DSO57_1012459 [Entomophthora muscae]KAJ9087095.1 hypothetical protein DSO57_1036696 [Entomophthora muscae]